MFLRPNIFLCQLRSLAWVFNTREITEFKRFVETIVFLIFNKSFCFISDQGLVTNNWEKLNTWGNFGLL